VKMGRSRNTITARAKRRFGKVDSTQINIAQVFCVFTARMVPWKSNTRIAPGFN